MVQGQRGQMSPELGVSNSKAERVSGEQAKARA